MSTFKHYEIGENYQLVLDIGSYLAPDHLCKQLEQIVWDLDTHMIESTYSSIGQNALHPKLMLSIIFYGYTQGIRSGRKLATACKESIPFMYLSRGYSPKKSAINDFRKNNYKHFSNLFNQVLTKCLDKGLGDPSLSIVDGSKLEANSSKGRTKTQAKYEKWYQYLQEDISCLETSLQSLSVVVEQSDEKKKLQSELASKQRLQSKVEKAIDQLKQDTSLKRLNLTDPDAPLMKGKKGNFDTNYNVQIACGEDQIINCCDVIIQGNDKNQLEPMLQGVMNNTKRKIHIALADADYGTYDSFEFMNQNHITGYVPYADMNTDFTNQPFHTSHFVYDDKNDHYTCPTGHQLKFYQTWENKKRKQHFKQYRVNQLHTCKNCHFRKQCVKKGAARRVIQRESRQHLKDEMKQRLSTNQGHQMYHKRLHPVESFFGHIKHNLAYNRFSLRGLEKVKAEFTLICLTYNLQKMITHSDFFKRILNLFEGFLTLVKAKILIFPNLSMNFTKHFK